MPDNKPTAEQLAERIQRGEAVSGQEVAQCLGAEAVADRLAALLELLKAYLNTGDVERAKALIERAWILSSYAPDLLDVYLQIQQHAGDVQAYRQALKRVGLARARQGQVSAALDMFNRWQYAYVAFQGEDRYEYDQDILAAVWQMASARRFQPAFQAPAPDEKLRVAYLMFGTTQANSVIVKISKLFAQYHDKARIEAAFYVPEPMRAVKVQSQAVEALAFIAAQGCNVEIAPDTSSAEESLVRLAESIHAYRPHLLVLNAALADFSHYFIAALQPAPVMLGFVSGPPAQFVPPELDWSIAWTWHPLIDTPVPCSHVRLEVELPDVGSFQPKAREEVGLPADAVVLAAGGRHLKFRAPAFWQTIVDLLERHPNAWFLAVGVTENQLAHILPGLDADIRARMRFVPWMQDYLQVLGTADILLDTFPSGGGVILQDAMAIGIPVVAYENDYLKPFDQADWSPAQEFMPACELVIPRGDRERYLEVVDRLIDDKAYRVGLGTSCRQHVRDFFGRPQRMVARCEAIYEALLQARSGAAQQMMAPALATATLQRTPELSRSLARVGQSDRPGPELEQVEITQEGGGLCSVEAHYRYAGKPAWATAEIRADQGLAALRLNDERNGRSLDLTAWDLYRLWARDYDFHREWDALRASGRKPTIAFTILSGSVAGGGPIILYRFAQWLSRLGYEVTIYSNDAQPTWVDLDCRYLTYIDPQERYAAITEDVVLVYSLLELLHVIKAHPAGKAIVHLCQGLEHLHYPEQGRNPVLQDTFDLFYALPVGRLVVSPHLYAFFAEHYAQQSFLVPNGVDGRVFKPQAGHRQPNPARKQVLLVGNPHDKNKNLASLLEALRSLVQRHPQWQWHLVCVSGQQVGPPALPPETGFTATLYCGLTPAELREQYEQSDVLANVSLYEGFGLPSIEAMACGTPVVQGNNQGMDGIARDGENCLLVDPADPEMIARAIELVCTDAALRDRLIAGGQATAADYSIAHQFDAFQAQFECLLGQGFDAQRAAAIRAELSGEVVAAREPAALSGTSGERPMFSILVPTYNHAKFLPAALDSILAQTFGDWEAVVVNDGSTDETPAILEGFAARDPRIRPIHKENGGTVSALNEALKQSRGRWICWLSSDDFFEPEKLAIHMAEIQKHPETRFFYTNFYLLDDPPGHKYPAQLDVTNYIPPEPHQVIRLFRYNYFNGITVAIDRALFEELGGFNPRYRAGHDFDMWLRISVQYRSRFIDCRLSTTRQHAGQDTRKSVMTGIIDSGVACLEYLNRHPFGDLFPALSLGPRDNAINAIQTTLSVVFSESSYMRICGMSVPLLDRLAEWLSLYSDKKFVSTFRQLIEANAAKPGIEPEVGTALTGLVKRLGARFVYKPYDPVELLKARMLQLQAGGDAVMADIFSQYLAQYSQRLHETAPAVAPAVAVQQVPSAFRSNLAYWKQIQDKGYFETHPCYQGLNDSADLGKDEEQIKKFVPLRKDMKAVVIGCGYGRESLRIAPHVGHVYGIDVNEVILAKAAKFLAEHGVHNFTPVPAEHWKERIPQGIDLVYSVVVFQHLTKDLVRDYIFGLADKLAPGGRFVVQFADAFHGQADAELKEYEPSVRWRRQEIEALVRQAGLELVTLESSQVTDTCIWHWGCFGKPGGAARAGLPAVAGGTKRRLLFVLHNFPPRNFGGVESYTYRMAKHLAAHGHEVAVAYAINSDVPCTPRVEESQLDGIRVMAIHCHNLRSPLDQVSHAHTEAVFRLILKEGRFELVHFQHFIGLPFSLTRLAHESGAKVCATLHDFYAICPRIHLFIAERNALCNGPESGEKCTRCGLGDSYDDFEPKMREQLIAATQNRLDQARSLLLDSVDLLTVPSAFVADVFSRYGYPRERLSVVPLGIEPVAVQPRREPNRGLTFGFAGNIHDVKNFTLLVEAFKQVEGEASLRFHGGGNKRDIQRLHDLIADDARISYHGPYKPSDLSEVFSSFDVLVIPSFIESYGLVVREAQSAGLPVIASRAGALPEAVEHLRNGLLFESGNAGELAGWMQRLVDQSDLLDSLRAGVVAPLPVDEDASLWETRYAQLLGDRVSRRRIVVYSNEKPEWACPQIRLFKPLSQLSEEFELVWGVRAEGEQGIADEELANDADLIVMQRFFPVSAHAELTRRLLASGKPIVLDIDDLIFDLPADNPHYAYAESVKPALIEALFQAEAVVCSSEPLRRRLAEYARNALLLPNAVDTALFHAPVPAPQQVVTLGLLGTQTHAADFALLETTLETLLAKYGERLRIVFMGMVPDRWKNHPGVSGHGFEPVYTAYADKLKGLGLDIALVPLADNAFNRAKSNIKWLEYSAAGIAGIYADLPPYNTCIRDGETGLLADNTAEAWADAIAYLIDNPEERVAIATAAQREVEERYSLSAVAPIYAETYRRLIGHRPGQATTGRSDAAAVKPAAQSAANARELYQLWQLAHAHQDRDALWIAERLDSLASRPIFHLVVIALEGTEDWLVANIKSLARQFYNHWRLSIVAETDMPEALAGVDVIHWLRLTGESPLQAANSLLMETEADWVGMFEAGDELAPHALFALVDAIDRHPEWSVVYSDEDSSDGAGNYQNPFFKTDFNLDMVRAASFAIGGLYLLQRELFSRLGGYRIDMEGVESYDLVLRAYEEAGAKGTGHVADVLYHRFIEGGHSRREQETMLAARQQALEEHLARCGLQTELWDGLLPGTYQIRYLHEAQPLVSIIIPTRNQMAFLQRCLDTLTEKTSYLNYEILIVDNGSDEPDAVAFLDQLRQSDPERLRILDYPHTFNFSAMNNLAAKEARGEYLLLLNNDTAVLHAEWLEEMLGYAQRPDVGIVGARLLFPNGNIQHAGVILGIGHSPAELVFINRESDDPGYFGRTLLPQNLSAVTGACLMIRKSVYHEVGGLDEKSFQVSYNDIDLCLKVRQRGHHVVWTPFATLMHEGSASQTSGVEKTPDAAKMARFLGEQNAMYDKWRREIAFDPAYNRNLSLANRDCLIELSPALTLDPGWRPRPRLLAHPADRMGCGEYRIIAPMRALNEAGRVMGWETGSYLTPPELFRYEPDSLVLQRQVEWSQIELIEQYMRHTKAFRVFEIDDLITNVPLKSVRKKVFVVQKDLHKRFRKGVSLCNRLVVSTDFLAEEYKGYADEVVMVPNYLEASRWGNLPVPLRREGKKPRVGWAGSVTHDGDLAEIVEVVKATADAVDWVFFGMCPKEMQPYVKEFHKPVPLDDYPAKLASLNLDLAVAPLEDVPFNHAKSHLRLLEYGVMGYPVICTDLTPYRGDYPVSRVRNRYKDWVDAIRSHVADMDELARMGDRLRDHVKANWMLEDHLDVWMKAWLP